MARSEITRAMDWGAIASVAISASSAQSSALTVGPYGLEIELCADTDCYVLIGANPTATTSSRFLAAGAAWTIRLDQTGLKVAVIRKSADGKLTILPALR